MSGSLLVGFSRVPKRNRKNRNGLHMHTTAGRRTRTIYAVRYTQLRAVDSFYRFIYLLIYFCVFFFITLIRFEFLHVKFSSASRARALAHVHSRVRVWVCVCEFMPVRTLLVREKDKRRFLIALNVGNFNDAQAISFSADSLSIVAEMIVVTSSHCFFFRWNRFFFSSSFSYCVCVKRRRHRRFVQQNKLQQTMGPKESSR